MTTVLIEPHPDDSFLGCSSLLNLGLIDSLWSVTDGDKELPEVTMPSEEYAKIRHSESNRFAKHFNLGGDAFRLEDGELWHNIPEMKVMIFNQITCWEKYTFFVPSKFESHPDHQAVSALSEWLTTLGRNSSVVWYSINASMPYPDQVIPVNRYEKEEQLMKFYPSQKSMLYVDYIVSSYEEFKVYRK